MDKSKLKKVAVDARRLLRNSVRRRMGQFGISEEVRHECRRSGDTFTVMDLLGQEVVLTPAQARQQGNLLADVEEKGFDAVVEETAYTIFNRLIAIRYMEVNDYLPSHERVLSGLNGEIEPEIVTQAPNIQLPLTAEEKVFVYDCKEKNQLDKLFRFLFFKECAALAEILPGLFSHTESYVELLFDLSYLKPDGVIRRLLTIDEEDFKDQVAIVGWLYQYYNSELKDETFALLKKNVKITKERIAPATQLFTPDWIVRYMVENSLGRLWRERKGSDEERMWHNEEDNFDWPYYVPEALQEENVRLELESICAARQMLKPEEITFIDPCMGSGHVLAYAFDVFMDIYRQEGYKPREAVENILTYNLYGLDIDERAWQLAYFAVMMKARQYYPRFFRHPVPCHLYSFTESNTFDRKSLVSFGSSLEQDERKEAQSQLENLLDEFTDAAEYGSILKIGDYDWELLHQYVDNLDETADGLFAGGLRDTQKKLQQIVNVGEVLAKKYDIVVTNPPYMGSSNMNPSLSRFMKANYQDYKSDLFAACMVRFTEMTKENGYLGFLSPYVWMFISSYEKLRKYFIEKKTIQTLIQFEYSAFEEATVPICTFVLQNSHIDKKGVYVRLTDYRGGMEVQRQKFLGAMQTHDKKMYFEANAKNFAKIPGEPVAYWVKGKVAQIFKDAPNIKSISELKAGLSTADNPRFQRNWFEVSFYKLGFGYSSINETSDKKYKWFPCLSGGKFRKWYPVEELVINWENNGFELRHKKGAALRNQDYYFIDGFTWNKLSSSNFAVRYRPSGFIYDDTSRVGKIINDEYNLFNLIGFLCSNVAFTFLQYLNPTMSFTNADLERLPVLSKNNKIVSSLVHNNIQLSKEDVISEETSWDFQRHPLLPPQTAAPPHRGAFATSEGGETAGSSGGTMTSFSLAACYENYKQQVNSRFDRLKANEEELNRIFIQIYGLEDELTPEVTPKDVTVARLYDEKEDIPENMKGNNYVLTRADVIKSLISYAVGCLFGRYLLAVPGLYYAGGEYPEDFSANSLIDADNIIPITDAEYFDDDLVSRFINFIRTAYGQNTLEANLQFIAGALGGKGTPRQIIRNYFLKEFYKDHVKIYKKRPIYWLFDSGKKNGFKALIYLHRYQPDLVGKVRTDYLHVLQRKLQEQTSRISQNLLQPSLGAADKARLKKEENHLLGQLAEIQHYDEVMAHLAYQRLALDLDDGVKVNYAKFQNIEVKHTDGTTEKMNLLAKI